MKELDCVALMHDLPEFQLSAGDVGAIVMDHGEDFDVEFVGRDGRTIALVNLPADALRVVVPEGGRSRPTPGQEVPSTRQPSV